MVGGSERLKSCQARRAPTQGNTRMGIRKDAITRFQNRAAVSLRADPAPPTRAGRPVTVNLAREARREFLPSALAVMERPNSPGWPWARAVIILMLACLAAWSYF